jgi:hypothetical protein
MINFTVIAFETDDKQLSDFCSSQTFDYERDA